MVKYMLHYFLLVLLNRAASFCLKLYFIAFSVEIEKKKDSSVMSIKKKSKENSTGEEMEKKYPKVWCSIM